MLRKLMGMLSVLVLLCAFCIGAQAADGQSASFQDFTFVKQNGYTTVITDLYGQEYQFSGILQVSTMEEHDAVSMVASYTIYHGAEQVLAVQLHDVQPEELPADSGTSNTQEAANGYYAADFSYGENDRYDAFVTGLSNTNIATVQDAVIGALLNQTVLEITDLNFIDTEKEYYNYDEAGNLVDTDTNLCWAAATSNILAYTGWGEQAGFETTDDLFDCFTASFSDEGSNVYYGISWFFNGSYSKQGTANWAQVDATDDMAYGTFQGYLNQYYGEALVENYALSTMEDYEYTFERLRENYGVNLNFGYYSKTNYKRNGGHAITLWGYVLDTEATGWENCYALLVTDSDSDVTNRNKDDNEQKDRRTAPNNLSYRTVYYTSVGADNSLTEGLAFDKYASSKYAVILDSINTLVPYDESVPTDDGSHDPGDPDLCASTFNLYTDNQSWSEAGSSFTSGEELLFSFYIYNAGGSATSEKFSYRFEVTSETGDVVAEYSKTFSRLNSLKSGYARWCDAYSFGKLEPGNYTLQLTINPEKTQQESYYGNNTLALTFRVVEYPELSDAVALHPGESVSLKAYHPGCYQSFAPEADGTWNFSVSGEKGRVAVWDAENQTWSETIEFTTEHAAELELPVKAGQPVYLCVWSDTDGDCCIFYTSENMACHLDEEADTLELYIPAEDGRHYMAATYAESGQMLSACTLTGTGYQTVSVTDAAMLRIFCLNAQTWSPDTEAREFTRTPAS